MRHASTDNNLAKPPRLQGRGTDPALSVQGQLEARQTGEFLRQWPLSAVLSSPLQRARQTALAIAQPQSLDVQTVDAFIEVDVGSWEGRSWDEIARNEPEAYRLFQEDPAEHAYQNGENLRHVYERVWPVLDRVLQEHLGQHIAIVGHNVVNRAILAPLLGLPLRDARGIKQDNGGINVIRYRAGELKLITVNGVFHLR